MKKVINFKEYGRMYFKNTTFSFEGGTDYAPTRYIRINNVPYEITDTLWIAKDVYKYHIRKDDRFIGKHDNWTIEANLYFYTDDSINYVEFDAVLYER